jgi:hypothetical protein
MNRPQSQIARWREICTQYGIDFPKGATKKELQALYLEHRGKLAVVTTENGLAYKSTEKPTTKYIVNYTISVSHEIRAESEKALREWVEYNAADSYNPYFGDIHDSWCDIDDVEVEE